MRVILAWVQSWSLSRRIAVAMVASLVAVQAQAFVQVWLSTSPEVRLTGTRWLAQTVASGFRDAMALPPAQRRTALRKRSQGLPVRLNWTAERPWVQSAGDPLARRLQATLLDILGTDAAAIQIVPTPLAYMFPVDSIRIEVEPPSVASRLGGQPVRAGDPDVLIPVNLRVAVQGHDGSWLTADPIGFVDGQAVRLVPFTALLTGAAIVATVSILTARRIVAPLGRLIVAAETVGASRELVSVQREGLGEFAAVARAFEDMQRRLLRFVADRTLMLAAISHDLRSALTRLRIAVESGAKAETILSEVDDMTAMVDSTLAFAEGEAQAAPGQPVDVAALLISLLDDFSDAGGRCDYRGPDHAVIQGQPVSLKRAFANLIDNALKYGGAAHVQVDVLPSALRVAVADEGPGIPPCLVEEAFRPFTRLDPARNGQPGVGLGLTIARDVVSRHEGTLDLRTAATGGVQAVIELPLRDRR